MKIRNGFVSNSSSSSFVVAISPECQIDIVDLIERLHTYNCDDTHVSWHDVNEQIKELKEELDSPWNGGFAREDMKLLEETMKDYPEHTLVGIAVSYYDGTLKTLLKHLEELKQIKIISQND